MYPFKLVFCRSSKEYIHDMDLPTGNQGCSHWFRQLSWLLSVCHCAFKLAWFGFSGLQELCAPLETLVCHLTSLELGFCQDIFALKQGQDICIYVCVFSHIYPHTNCLSIQTRTCVYIHIYSLQSSIYFIKLSFNVTFLFFKKSN